jgi:hypothetical protein
VSRLITAWAISAVLLGGMLSPPASAAPLPAPGVVTGGVFNLCDRYDSVPVSDHRRLSSFTYAGRIIKGDIGYTVTHGEGTLDVLCAYVSGSIPADLTMVSATPKGTFTTVCSGRVYPETTSGLGSLSGAVPETVANLVWAFGGLCDGEPGVAVLSISVEFVLYGPDLNPGPSDSSYSVAGAYAEVQDSCRTEGLCLPV